MSTTLQEYWNGVIQNTLSFERSKRLRSNPLSEVKETPDTALVVLGELLTDQDIITTHRINIDAELKKESRLSIELLKEAILKSCSPKDIKRIINETFQYYAEKVKNQYFLGDEEFQLGISTRFELQYQIKAAKELYGIDTSEIERELVELDNIFREYLIIILEDSIEEGRPFYPHHPLLKATMPKEFWWVHEF